MKTDAKTSTGTRRREIFLAALDKADPKERRVFLEEACGQDQALRQSVEELLKEHLDVGSFLETPAHSAAITALVAGVSPGGTAMVATVTEQPGDVIGRYKLLQKIGEGGCGVVYMAEQEQPVRRRVALKIIKLGMDTGQVIARFEAERQALALMEHPNIAKVLDAGATEAGRPFFVMELVRGIKITDYCDQNSLSTEERLGLFIQVCQAIQHAHQKGIIHRDIKPSNILVTSHDGVPVPKVIDFGVAKATNQQRLTDRTLFTAFEQFIGTPAYMSPEQAEMSGLDIDTRSDIYSLGVLLYELLTGKTPFDAESLLEGGLDACRRTIREQEPVWPSTRLATLLDAELTTTAKNRRAEAPRLIHMMSGDLDWVVMKALDKDRTRRYATANAMGTDIQRFLENEPVVARPPSTWYRTQKWVRRHRGAFAATAAVMLALVTGTAISLWQAVRAREAEQQAQSAQETEKNLRHTAERERERAREQASRARLNEYVADVNLAQQALAAGNFGRAAQLLKKHTPQNGEPDLRGFEWRYLWQLCQGDSHDALPKQEGAVHSLAVSPDGQLLAIGLFEKLAIWSLPRRTLLTTLPSRVISMAFSPDSKTLMASTPTSVRIWNTSDWTEHKSLHEDSGAITLSKDGSTLAVSSRGGVRIWHTSDWSEPRELWGSFGPAALSSDGKLLLAQTTNGLTIWNSTDAEPRVVLENSTNLFFRMMGPMMNGGHAVAFSPDGRFVVAARNLRSERGVFVVGVWDAQTGREVGTLPENPEHIEHTGMISELGFSPDGQILATASLDHSIRLWDFSKRRPLSALHGHLTEVWAIAFSADGSTLISGGKDGSIKLWSTHAAKKDEAFPGASEPLAFSKDARTLAAFDLRSNAVVFLSVATREPEATFPLERRSFRFHSGFALSGDLGVLAEGLDDGQVRLLNTQTRETAMIRVGQGCADTVAIASDGRQLITGGFQQPTRWWDLRTGTNTLLDAEAHRLLFSPDGSTLASFGRSNQIQLWDSTTRSVRTNLALELPAGFAAAFSQDGKLLATTADPNDPDQAIKLWEVATGKLLGSCTGHKQPVFSLAFSADGKTLASSSDDSTLKLWNIATQQELLSLPRLGAGMTQLLFSPDGQFLAASAGQAKDANALRLYRAPLVSEIDRSAENHSAIP